MGTTLTSKRIKDTYSGLLKTTDNAVIDGTLRKVTDGQGNDSAMSISTTDVRIDGDLELDGGLRDVNGSLGSVGQTLKSNGSGVVWSNSSSVVYRATTSDDITINDEVVNVTSGSGTYTLPTAVGNDGLILYVKNSGGGVIIVDGNGSQTIDGDLTISLSSKESLTLCSDGANWIVL